MTWLSPFLLWGLAALAAPLLLHVLRRAPRRRYAFPSLFLLKKVQKKYRRRLVMMELLLLLLRLLVVAGLVLAFAGPRLKERLTGRAVGAHLVVLYDDTASMARLRGGATLFEAARQRIRATLAAMPPRHRVTLVALTGGVLAVQSPKAATAALGALDVSHAPADMPRALKAVNDALGQEGGRVLVVGDFQASTWGAFRLAPRRGVAAQAAWVAPPVAGGLVINNLSAKGQVVGGAPFTLQVDLTAAGVERGQPLRVMAEMPGGVRATAGAPGGAGNHRVLVRLTAPQSGLQGVKVTAAIGEANATGYTVVGVGGLGRVLVVAAPDDPAREVLGALLTASRAPQPVVVAPQGLAGVAVEQFRAIVVSGAAPPLLAQQDALALVAQNGAVVVSFAGVDAGAPPAAGAPPPLVLLGPRGAGRDSRWAGAESFWTVRGEAAMADFTGPMAGAWPGVKVFQSVALEPGAGQPLARLSSGHTAISRLALGKGAWVSVATGLDPRQSDLAFMPAFAPMMLRLLQPTLVSEGWQRAATGQVITLPWRGKPAGSTRAVEAFEQTTAHWQVNEGGRLGGYPAPGLWLVGEEKQPLAVTLSAQEQAPATLTEPDLKSRAPGLSWLGADAAPVPTLARTGDPLWLARWLGVLALALVVAEAAFANSRRMTEAPGG